VEARRIIDRHYQETGHKILLEIDGGVKPDNIGQIAALGADTFVAGSAIFGKKSITGYREAIDQMRAAIDRDVTAAIRAAEDEAANQRG
jgi:ribulose-phosphate 3-epimerase